jgi:hypothetical protein
MVRHLLGQYSQSILFLTTNRVSNFDDAIISRIHLMLRYEALSKDSKTQIWKSFLARAPAKYGPAKVNTKELDQLAARSSNGRQVGTLSPQWSDASRTRLIVLN